MSFRGRDDDGLYRGDPVPEMLPPADPPGSDQWATPPGTGPWAHPPGTGPWAPGGSASSSFPAADGPRPRPTPIVLAGRLSKGFGIGILLLGAGYVALAIYWAIMMFTGADPSGTFWGVFTLVVAGIVGLFVAGIGMGFLEATKALNHHSGTLMFIMCGIAIVAGLGGTEFIGLVLSYLPVPGIAGVLRVAVVLVPVVIIGLLLSTEGAAWRKQPTDWRGAWRLF